MKDLKENPKLTQELLRNLLLCCSTLFQRSIHAADQRFARLSSSHCHVVLGQNHVFYSIFTTCLHIFAYFCTIRKLTSYFSGIDRVFQCQMQKVSNTSRFTFGFLALLTKILMFAVFCQTCTLNTSQIVVFSFISTRPSFKADMQTLFFAVLGQSTFYAAKKHVGFERNGGSFSCS